MKDTLLRLENKTRHTDKWTDVQLPTPLVFIGCLLSDPISIPKTRIICRPIFKQINTYYTAEYFAECILSEKEMKNKINILNDKPEQLNNMADTINKYLAPVIKFIYIKTNVSYAKPFLNIWLIVIGFICMRRQWSVLFFSRPRSKGWPHHGRSIYLCLLSFWLTLPQGVLSTYWCCPSSHLALFLALSLSTGQGWPI